MFKTLIVEDSVVFRRALGDILRARFPFMEVAEAGDGEEALEKVDVLTPDLVFMDIRLPGANGLDLTRAIKAAHGGITVIILTGYDLPEYRNAALQCGADHFIAKGASTEAEILALVDSIAASGGR